MKTTKRSMFRLMTVILSAILLLGMLSVASLAADGDETKYTVGDGGEWKTASFADAVLAVKDAATATIVLQKNVTLTEGVTISGGGNITITSADGSLYSINRGSDFTTSVFTVSGGTTLTFKNITLDGQGTIVNTHGAMISLSSATDTVTLDSGATIQNSYADPTETSDKEKNGGAVYAPSGNVVMKEGAAILNCGARKGGGLYLGGISASSPAKFDMSGGLITGCVVEGTSSSGAAVYMHGYTTFNMSGGMIVGNTSERIANYQTHKVGTVIDGAVASIRNHSADMRNYINISGDAIIRNNIGYRRNATRTEEVVGADIVYTLNNQGFATLNIAFGFTGSIGLAYPTSSADTASMGVAVATAASEYSAQAIIPGLIDNNSGRVAKVMSDKNIGWTEAGAEVDADGTLKRYVSLAEALEAASASDKAIVSLLKDATLTKGVTISGGGDITITSADGGSYSIYRGSEFEASVFKVSGGTTLTFKNITLDGQNKAAAVNGAMISLSSAADTVILDSGTTIQNSIASIAKEKYGGAIYTAHGTVEMKDGAVIQNCQALKGGAIALSLTTANNKVETFGTFNMSGGLITGCVVPDNNSASGAAVYMDGGSRFNMSGGMIAGNTSGRTAYNANLSVAGTMIDGAVASIRNTNSDYRKNYITISGNAVIRNNYGYRYEGNAVISSDKILGADIVYTVNNAGNLTLTVEKDFTGSIGFAYPANTETEKTVVAVAATGYEAGTILHGLIDNNSGRVAKVTASGVICWADAEAEMDKDGKITRYDKLADAYKATNGTTPIKLLANVSGAEFLKEVGAFVKIIANGKNLTFSENITCGDPVSAREKVGAFTYGTYSYEGVDADVSIYTATNVKHIHEPIAPETAAKPTVCSGCGMIVAFPTDKTCNARYSLDDGKMWTYTAFADAMNAVIGKTGIVEIYRDITLDVGVTVSGNIMVRSLPVDINAVDANKIYTVSRGSAFTTSVFTVKDGATLTFKNITLDGQNIAANVNGAMISLSSAADTVILDSGTTIQNSIASIAGEKYGGAIYTAHGTIEMKDGAVIQNCQALKGGAIALDLTVANNKVVTSGTLNMSGGLITGCVVPDNNSASGAALYMNGGSRFNMSGGMIAGNTSGRTHYIKANSVAGTMIDGAVASIRNANTEYRKNYITISGDAVIRNNYGYRYEGNEVISSEKIVGADIVYTVNNAGNLTLKVEKDFTGSIGFAYPANTETEKTVVAVAATGYEAGTILHGLIDNNSGRVAKVTASGVICWADAEAELDIDGKITRYVSLDDAWAIVGSTTPITLMSNASITFGELDDSAKIIENGYAVRVNFKGGVGESDGEEVIVGAFSYGDYETVGETKTAFVYTAILGGSIADAGLVAGTDLSMRFFAYLSEGFEDAILRVTRNDVSVDIEGVRESNGQYCFVYRNIAPQNAGDSITAELMLNGEILDTYSDYSVLKYCQALLAISDEELGMTAEKAAELRTLTRDLLEYCAMAQLYIGYKTDALVNEGIKASEFYPMMTTPKKCVSHNTVEGVSFTAAGLRFDNVNNLYFSFTTPNPANTKLVVNGIEHTSEEFKLVSGTTYKWYSEGLSATDFDDVFTVELYFGNTPVQTFTYSAAAYVYSMLDYNNEAMQNLAKATYNYGVAARMYTNDWDDTRYTAQEFTQIQGAKTLGGASLSGTALTMSHAASGIEFSFRGKGDITLNITATESARIEIAVDSGKVEHFLVNIGTNDYIVANDLRDGKHTVRIVQESGAVTLNSVSLKGYPTASEEDTMYIEFVGGNILSGHALYLNYELAEDDATGAYAVLAARELGARYLISDMTKNFAETTDYPDLVVIDYKEGTDYSTVLANIKAAYGPNVKILFAAGAMDTPNETTLSKLGDFVKLTSDTTGYERYPSMGGSAIMGAELAKYIREKYDFFTPEEVSAAKQDIIVEVAEPENGYNSFYVYIKTSDPSGRYYIRYSFIHEYSEVYDNFIGSSGTNRSNFRVKGAICVEVTDIGETAVEYKPINSVLEAGEISAALRTMVDQTNKATDFTGGFHGDEWIVGEGTEGTDTWKPAVSLIADGNEIDIVNGSARVITCNSVIFDQSTMMYEYQTSTADSRGEQLTTHDQHFTITREGGIHNRQSFVWQKKATLAIDDNYMQMFTMQRYDGSSAICTEMETFDADGRSNGKASSVAGTVPVSYSVLSDATNRAVQYSSATTGFSSNARYDLCSSGVFSENKATIQRSWISVRETIDNKLYVAFKSAQGEDQVTEGEFWTLDVAYNIDYVAPNN